MWDLKVKRKVLHSRETKVGQTLAARETQVKKRYKKSLQYIEEQKSVPCEASSSAVSS